MANITIQMINDLRAATNVGMMDCKRALQETDGNMEEAIKILREKGLALQVKRADRESKQGIITAAAGENGAYGMIELNDREVPRLRQGHRRRRRQGRHRPGHHPRPGPDRGRGRDG